MGAAHTLNAVKALSHEIVSRDFTLIYGGAKSGLMAQLADDVLAGGGKVIGVMPRVLLDKEETHPTLTDLHIVDSMQERKRLMSDLVDGFVVLPE